LRSLLMDRGRFSQFLRRESSGVREAAESILGARGGLTSPMAEIQIQRCLASAWREQAELTAELCDSAITPLDGEDLRALACSLTAVIEALHDVQAAASRITGDPAAPLEALCRAALDYVTAVCDAIPEPKLLSSEPSRMAILASRSMAMRSARRDCESSLLATQELSDCQLLARWSLIEEFRRLRSCLDDACEEMQRVVLKNS